MDTEDLIQKCKAISIKKGIECKLSFKKRNVRKKRKHNGKLFSWKNFTGKEYTHERNWDCIAQAWRRAKEVKIESMGNNIFLFKFGSEVDK